MLTEISGMNISIIIPERRNILKDIPVEKRVIGYKMMYMRNVGIAKNRRQKLGLIRNNALDRNSDVRRIAIVATIVCPSMINRD